MAYSLLLLNEFSIHPKKECIFLHSFFMVHLKRVDYYSFFMVHLKRVDYYSFFMGIGLHVLIYTHYTYKNNLKYDLFG